MKTVRCEDLDMGKALGMLAVFWGHLMLGGITNLSCYAVHIPFFFFLSGVVYRHYGSLRDFLVRRARGLLAPYLLFSAGTWLWWVVRGALLGALPERPLAALAETLVARGSAGYLRHNVALWFVTALYAAEVLYYFLERLPLAPRIPVLALCGLLGYALVQPGWPLDFRRLPWNLEAALTGVVFYGAGNIFAQTGALTGLRRLVREHRAAAGLLCLLLLGMTALGAQSNGHVSIAQGRLGSSLLLFYTNAALGICGVMVLSILLTQVRLPEKLRRWLLWLGRRSFWAMAIHVPVMVDLVWIAGRFTDIDELRYRYVWTVPIFIGMLIVSSLWMGLLEKLLRKE